MPRVRRENLPRALWVHLLGRMHQREISLQQLYLFSKWLESEPEVPSGPWFKRFPEMTVCGEGELVKSFLTAAQTPVGKELPQASPNAQWREAWLAARTVKRCSRTTLTRKGFEQKETKAAHFLQKVTKGTKGLFKCKCSILLTGGNGENG